MVYQGVKLLLIFLFAQLVVLFIIFYPISTKKRTNVIDENINTIVKNINVTETSQNEIILTKKSNLASLFDIGTKYQTDKIVYHQYHRLYEKYFSKYRDNPIRLLEIGLGCQMKTVGSSAQTWREYFGPKAEIHFVELDEICGKIWQNITGNQLSITMHYGSQENVTFLEYLKSSLTPFDVIIDDGGHTMNQQKTSFLTLLPLVRQSGLYVIEDLETSYIADYGGQYLNSTTMIELIKVLVDDVQPESPKKTIPVSSLISSFEIGDGICFFTLK